MTTCRPGLIISLDEILLRSWQISLDEDSDKKEQLAAMALVKECATMKIELLSSGAVVDRAFKLVRFQQSKIIPLPPTSQNGEVIIDDSQESA